MTTTTMRDLADVGQSGWLDDLHRGRFSVGLRFDRRCRRLRVNRHREVT
jgi:hypothetical protein